MWTDDVESSPLPAGNQNSQPSEDEWRVTSLLSKTLVLSVDESLLENGRAWVW